MAIPQMRPIAAILSLSVVIHQSLASDNTSFATASKACVAFGQSGLAEAYNCESISGMTSFPQTGSLAGTWAVELDTGLVIDGTSNTVTLWLGGSESTSISLGPLTTPVGGFYLHGKVYVACFGSWPTPKGDSGLAVIDVAGKRLESTHVFSDSRMHVHNAYAFDFAGTKEIFVAVLGNPWEGPLAGKGLVRFDQSSHDFVVDTTMGADLNVRSAKQQADGSIFIVTQEPNGQDSKLGRLEERSGHLAVVSLTTLPPRVHGGDGGADIVLGMQKDTLWVTDRQASVAGKLYYYTYSGKVFTMVNVRDTGVNPRYTVALLNGDIVSCNQDSNDLSVYKGLALHPEDTSIGEQRISTVASPMFFLQTTKVQFTASGRMSRGMSNMTLIV